MSSIVTSVRLKSVRAFVSFRRHAIWSSKPHECSLITPTFSPLSEPIPAHVDGPTWDVLGQALCIELVMIARDDLGGIVHSSALL